MMFAIFAYFLGVVLYSMLIYIVCMYNVITNAVQMRYKCGTNAVQMTPCQLTLEDWTDIKSQISAGESWQNVADNYGMVRESLAQAGRKKGIKTSRKAGEPGLRKAIPAEIGRGYPHLRKMLSQISRETSEKDPEVLLSAARGILARGIDAVVESIEADGDDGRYDGLDDLGLGYSTAANDMGKTRFKRLSQRCIKDEMGVRDMMAYARDLARLETDRLAHYKPKLASVKADIVTKVDPSSLTAAERKERIAMLEASLVGPTDK